MIRLCGVLIRLSLSGNLPIAKTHVATHIFLLRIGNSVLTFLSR
jgi:hypothetical protein